MHVLNFTGQSEDSLAAAFAMALSHVADGVKTHDGARYVIVPEIIRVGEKFQVVLRVFFLTAEEVAELQPPEEESRLEKEGKEHERVVEEKKRRRAAEEAIRHLAMIGAVRGAGGELHMPHGMLEGLHRLELAPGLAATEYEVPEIPYTPPSEAYETAFLAAELRKAPPWSGTDVLSAVDFYDAWLQSREAFLAPPAPEAEEIPSPAPGAEKKAPHMIQELYERAREQERRLRNADDLDFAA